MIVNELPNHKGVGVFGYVSVSVETQPAFVAKVSKMGKQNHVDVFVTNELQDHDVQISRDIKKFL